MPDENDIVYTQYGVDPVSLLERIAEAIRSFFGYGDPLAGGNGASGFLEVLGYWWDIYSIFAILLSLLFFLGFIYARMRALQLLEMEEHHLVEEERAWQHAYEGKAAGNNRWKDVGTHMASSNPNDWRLAIIEADVMLDEVLDAAGFVGASIGDKLKTANPASFTTVRDAWDAHMIRNKIAHAGGDFVLTKRIAQEAVVKYERVFREFGAI